MLTTDYQSLGTIVYEDRIYDSDQIKRMTGEICKIIDCNNRLDKQKITIAILLDRSILQVFSILALLQLHITYVPIDSSLPSKRIQYMIDNSCADYVLVDENTKDILKNDEYSYISLEGLKSDETIRTYCLPKKNEIAYVIYTSGSTGCPKGVEITRESLWNFFEYINKEICIRKEDVVVSFTNYAFDIFFMETIMPLLLGATIFFANDREIKNPSKMKNLIVNSNATILQITPSRLRVLELYDNDFVSLSKLHKIFVGGERLTDELLRKLQGWKNLRIYNLYGPTEATIWVTISELTQKSTVDIGKPIGGCELNLFLGEKLITEDEEIGELYISGKCLSSGYRNNPSKNLEAFVEKNGIRYYKSGDLAKRSHGNYFFVGRIDNQVKVNGYRIELDEIDETIKRQYDYVYPATCYDEKYGIILFYKSPYELDNTDVRRYLMNELPIYMIPRQIVKVSEFEYTTSGKINKRETVSKNEIYLRTVK